MAHYEYDNENEMSAINKLENLANALKACGIECEWFENQGVAAFGIGGTLWNCINGNEENFVFYFEEGFEDEIQSYIEPTTDKAEIMKKLKDL